MVMLADNGNGNGNMASSINDGLRRWRPTADWRCLANGWVAAQGCVCRLWAVAWVAGSSG